MRRRRRLSIFFRVRRRKFWFRQWKIISSMVVFGFLFSLFGIIVAVPLLFARHDDRLPVTLDDWDGERPISIVFSGDPVRLFLLSPRESTLTVLNFEGETMLTVPHGYGQYRLAAIEELGSLDSELGGPRLLMHTLQEFMAIPIDGYIRLPKGEDQEEKSVDEMRKLLKTPLKWTTLSSLTHTLDTKDLLQFFWHLAWIRFDRVTIVDALEAQNEKEILQQRFLTAERPRVSVLNGTDSPGLAAAMARYVEPLGGLLVRVGNANEKTRETRLYGNPASPVVQRLVRVLGVFCPETCMIEGDSSAFDVDVALVVGEDYRDFLYGAVK